MPIPRAEMETTASLEKATVTLRLWTSDPTVAKKWRKLGYPVTPFGTQRGEAVSWSATVPARCLGWRRMAKSRRPGAGAHLKSPRKAPSSPASP